MAVSTGTINASSKNRPSAAAQCWQPGPIERMRQAALARRRARDLVGAGAPNAVQVFGDVGQVGEIAERPHDQHRLVGCEPVEDALELGPRCGVVVAAEGDRTAAMPSMISKVSAPSCSRTVSPSRRPSRRTSSFRGDPCRGARSSNCPRCCELARGGCSVPDVGRPCWRNHTAEPGSSTHAGGSHAACCSTACSAGLQPARQERVRVDARRAIELDARRLEQRLQAPAAPGVERVGASATNSPRRTAAVWSSRRYAQRARRGCARRDRHAGTRPNRVRSTGRYAQSGEHAPHRPAELTPFEREQHDRLSHIGNRTGDECDRLRIGHDPRLLCSCCRGGLHRRCVEAITGRRARNLEFLVVMSAGTSQTAEC